MADPVRFVVEVIVALAFRKCLEFSACRAFEKLPLAVLEKIDDALRQKIWAKLWEYSAVNALVERVEWRLQNVYREPIHLA